MHERRVLVLGIGNLLAGDDGIGPHVAAVMRERRLGHGAVVVEDGGTLGLALLPRLVGFDALVLVDATELHEPPGTIRVLGRDLLGAAVVGRLSAHETGLIDLLATAEFTGTLPRQVALVAVQPGDHTWGVTLSPAVADAIPVAAEAAAAAAQRFLTLVSTLS